jgi:tRNA(fMet)-specific endonuclease VapC
MYLLDTNTCIQYISRRNPAIIHRLQSRSPREVFVCDVVKFELYYGAYRSAYPEHNLNVLREFFSEFVSLPFDGHAAQICGQLRAELAALGTPIGPYDLQIAAIALANNLAIVTHNVREFNRVNGLTIEDWEL